MIEVMFIAGMFVGSVITVVIMSLMFISKEADQKMEGMYNE